MDLFDIEETPDLRRKEVATQRHALADTLASNHSSVEFTRAGRRIERA